MFCLKELLDKNDAVVLCMGATAPRDLSVPGRELDGVYQAVAFLETWQRNQAKPNKKPAFTAKDRHVIILGNCFFLNFSHLNLRIGVFKKTGGGDTGTDCIATSLRQGAKSILQFEILPPPPSSRAKDNPWPQWARVFKVDYGHEEAKARFGKDPRLFNMLTKVFNLFLFIQHFNNDL